MYQVVQKTEEEQIAMYMKSSKRKLIAMLMENQSIVRSLTHQWHSDVQVNTDTVTYSTQNQQEWRWGRSS